MNVKQEDVIELGEGDPSNDYSPGMISGSWAVDQLLPMWFLIWGMRLAHVLPQSEVSTSSLAPDFSFG